MENLKQTFTVWTMLNIHLDSLVEVAGKSWSEEKNEGRADRLLARLAAFARDGVLDDGPEGESAVVDGQRQVIDDVFSNRLPRQAVFTPVDVKSNENKINLH